MGPYIKEKALKNKINATQKKKRELVTTKRKIIENDLYESRLSTLDNIVSCDDNEGKADEMPELRCELDKNKCFDSLTDMLSEKTLNSIQKVGLKHMTPVQAKCIPLILNGKHVRATAKTGSGKTLAFLIPAIELIQKQSFKPRNGTGVIILSPTRELTMQTYGVLKELAQDLSQTIDMLVGGSDLKSEKKRLNKGVNIIVSTPRRLIYHLQNTDEFIVKNCFSIILDEADRLIDGFEEELKQIFKQIPAFRHTVLFSATKNEKCDKLANIALPGGNFIDIDIDEDLIMATVSTLEQAYVLLPIENKFSFLLTFLESVQTNKTMVFFSCCEVVKFYFQVVNYTHFPVLCIHGNQERPQRNKIFRQFCNAASGILFCTDVAARGWDIPVVDWIVQYDPPDGSNEYIHRVGRTARAGASGKSLLFLSEEEIQFIQYLREAKVDVMKKEVAWSNVGFDFQDKFERMVAETLHCMAKCAFRGFIRSYKNHKLKNAFDINKLNIKAVSKCFGFRNAPDVRDIIKGIGPDKNRKIMPTENNYAQY